MTNGKNNHYGEQSAFCGVKKPAKPTMNVLRNPGKIDAIEKKHENDEYADDHLLSPARVEFLVINAAYAEQCLIKKLWIFRPEPILKDFLAVGL